MSQDYQGGVCEGNLWMINSYQNLFRTSPCSSDFAWSNLNLSMNMEASREENNRHNITQKPADFVDSRMSYPYPLRAFNTQDSSYDSLKSQAFLTNQQQAVMNPITASGNHDLFPLNSASSYDYSSSIGLFQNLFDMSSDETRHDDQPLLDNLLGTQTMKGSVSFPSSGSYGEKDSGNNSQFIGYNNSTGRPYWSASTAVTCDVGASVLSSTPPQFVASSVSTTTKPRSFAAKRHSEVKKAPNEHALKRKKTETPSPLPTFKVRKEKLGDRITALQQMVSPFGKTDTASVLHEAIEYIKFLHDQVKTLSTPYMKNASPQVQYQQIYAKYNTSDQIGQQQDLRSRGLCLVPISSTLPVASETTNNVWTPNFRGNFM